jgi:hypothetical protein
MNKYTLLLILFLGITFVVINLTVTLKECPKPQTIYRYLPRTFEEEQNEPVLVSDIFKTMFSQPSPWIGSINDLDTRKSESINRYFISQQ